MYPFARILLFNTVITSTCIVSGQNKFDATEYVETVITAMVANREKLSGISADLELRSGPMVSRSRVLFDGQSFRRENLNNEGSVTEILVFTAGRWTQYSPEHAVVWIRKPEQMSSSILPIDPREFAAPDMKTDLGGFLQQCRLESATLSHDTSNAPNIVLACATPTGRQHAFWFSSAFDFLPIWAVEYGSDASISVLTSLTYRRIEERDAWLPTECRYRVFEDGALFDVKRADTAQSLGGFTTRVCNVKLVRDLEDDAFAVDIKDGTRVHDVISGKSGYKGPRPIRTTAVGVNVRYIVIVVVLAVVVLFILGRRMVKSRQKSG